MSDWRSITDDREKYAAYLCSREWAEKREAVRERAGGKCERCCVLPMDACHHLTYERKYNERQEDLQAICNPCHEFTHGKSSIDPQPNASFVRWLSVCHPDSVPWLHRSFTLGEAFQYPQLCYAIQLWVAVRVQESAIADECDHDPAPTALDMYTFKIAEPAVVSFRAWLNYDCPSQFPKGDADAYQACHEWADRIRKL